MAAPRPAMPPPTTTTLSLTVDLSIIRLGPTKLSQRNYSRIYGWIWSLSKTAVYLTKRCYSFFFDNRWGKNIALIISSTTCATWPNQKEKLVLLRLWGIRLRWQAHGISRTWNASDKLLSMLESPSLLCRFAGWNMVILAVVSRLPLLTAGNYFLKLFKGHARTSRIFIEAY